MNSQKPKKTTVHYTLICFGILLLSNHSVNGTLKTNPPNPIHFSPSSCEAALSYEKGLELLNQSKSKKLNYTFRCRVRNNLSYTQSFRLDTQDDNVQVSPRQGTLLPGEAQSINVSVKLLSPGHKKEFEIEAYANEKQLKSNKKFSVHWKLPKKQN